MFYSVVYTNITSSLFLKIYFTIMLLPIVSFILIVLTALKIVLSSCTQASKVNFLKIQFNFSVMKIVTTICTTFIHICLGIQHSNFTVNLVNYSDYCYIVIGSRFLYYSSKKKFIISCEKHIVFTNVLTTCGAFVWWNKM